MSEKIADQLKKKFGNHKVPEPIIELADYFDKHSWFFAGTFEVSADVYNGAKAWFRGNEEGYSKVLVFGHDGIDSLFALWMYEGRTTANAPVIYLSGEGEGTTILADNINDFLSILATNQDWEPFDKEFTEPYEEYEDNNLHFQRWLQTRYNIKPASKPMKLVQKAIKNHPDLHKWIQSVRPV